MMDEPFSVDNAPLSLISVEMAAGSVQTDGATGVDDANAVAHTEQLLHELRRQQVELEGQNAELRRQQAALVEREQFFLQLANNLPALISYWTPDLRCAFANQGYLDWFGRTAAQMHGLPMQELHGAQLFEQNLPYVRAVLAGAPQRFERSLSRADGSTAHLLAQYLAHVVDGEVRGFFALVTDISAIRQGQEQLRASEARLRAIFDASPACIKVLDRHGALLDMNAVGMHMLEAESLAAVQAPGVLNFILPHYRGAFSALHQRVLAGENGCLQFEVMGLRGTPRWLESHAVPLRDDADEVIGVLAVTVDVSDSRQAQQLVQASLHEKEALLKEVHHRVKNNLQVITSLLRLEIRRSDQTATKTVLDEMQSRIRTMSLLHESLYRSGTFAALNLGGYLRQVATQAFRAQQIVGGAIQLQVQLAAIQVGMDQAMPCGLLLNELIANCLKHGFLGERSGEVLVELHLLDQPRQVRLRVSDNGVGLPANFSLHSSPGIGLQLVHDLARQLGGTLEIGAGPGGCFSVIFTAKALPISPSTN
jgi:PAS domain S-box-containing protein